MRKIVSLLTRLFVSAVIVATFYGCERPNPKQSYPGNPHNSSPKEEQHGGIHGSSGRPRNNNRVARSNATKKIEAASESEGNERKLAGSEIFKLYNPAVFMVFTDDGNNAYQGSGFFISPDGYGVSNYHVFEGTYKSHAQIKLSNGERYPIGEIIYSDADKDIILFKINIKGCKFIPLSKKEIKVGEHIFAIGSPRGYENTLSDGMVSQLRPDEKYGIQISAPIDHGSSGGALINEYGEAIGVTSAGRDDSGANLNFAINLREVLEGISQEIK